MWATGDAVRERHLMVSMIWNWDWSLDRYVLSYFDSGFRETRQDLGSPTLDNFFSSTRDTVQLAGATPSVSYHHPYPILQIPTTLTTLKFRNLQVQMKSLYTLYACAHWAMLVHVFACTCTTGPVRRQASFSRIHQSCTTLFTITSKTCYRTLWNNGEKTKQRFRNHLTSLYPIFWILRAMRRVTFLATSSLVGPKTWICHSMQQIQPGK